MARGKDKVLNDRPRKVFRNYIGNIEVVFSIAFVAFTGYMAWWFYDQRDAYDPSERDISMDVLIEQSVEDNLWEPPLKRWTEPGAAVAAASAQPDIGIFPPVLLSNGWKLDSRVEQFNWDNLWEKINGQETQYKQFGFELLHYVSVYNPEAELGINIELYEMGSFQNALGVFAAQRGDTADVESLGNAYYYPTGAGAIGIVQKYYYKLTGTAEDPAIEEHALRFIEAFESQVKEVGETPPTFALLAEGLGLQFQDIEYKKEDVFQYDFAKDFWFGHAPDDSDLRYYVHEAADEAEAAALFDQILEEHEWDFQVELGEGNNAALYHEFLKTHGTLNQQGKYVYGVENAASKDEAEQALSKLESALLEESA